MTTDNSYGSGKSTADMKEISNLTGFLTTDFANSPTQYAANGVFNSINNKVKKGYPVLKAFGYTGDTNIEVRIQTAIT